MDSPFHLWKGAFVWTILRSFCSCGKSQSRGKADNLNGRGKSYREPGSNLINLPESLVQSLLFPLEVLLREPKDLQVNVSNRCLLQPKACKLNGKRI